MVRFTLVENEEPWDLGTLLDSKPGSEISTTEFSVKICSKFGINNFGPKKMADLVEYRLTPENEQDRMLPEYKAKMDSHWGHVSSCKSCSEAIGVMRYAILDNMMTEEKPRFIAEARRFFTGLGYTIQELGIRQRLVAQNQ